MKKTNFVIFLILVISSSTLLATDSKCYSIANKVKDASIFYRSLFEKKMAEISLICQNSNGNFSITNYDNGVSFVYSGVLPHLLTVEINRVVGTNEVFRFSRHSGKITQYESFDSRNCGFIMSFHANGNLRCFAQIKNAFFYGNEYFFDEEGRLERKSDVTGKPVFIISTPQKVKVNQSIKVTDKLINTVKKL